MQTPGAVQHIQADSLLGLAIMLIQAVGLMGLLACAWFLRGLKGEIVASKSTALRDYTEHHSGLMELEKIVTSLVHLAAQNTTTMAVFDVQMKDIHRRLRALERDDVTDTPRQ